MLSVLMLALKRMNRETKSLGFQTNCMVKDQDSNYKRLLSSLVPLAGDNDEIVQSITYLGVDIHNAGSSEHDIRKRTAIARNCVANIDRSIWRALSSLFPPSYDSRLHPVVILYGAETWSPI